MKSSLDESSYVENNSSSSEILLASEQPKKRAGRRKFKETRHPVYRGVRRRNNNNKWVCEVRVPNDKSTRIWLGTYPTPEMAARAHDVAALALRGKSACLNFADSTWRLALPATNNAKEIRKMAAEAALAFAVVEDSKEQTMISNCDVNSVGVMEVDNKPLQGLCVEVPEEEMLHDWFRSMADEPLRSPITPFIRHGRDQWNNVDIDQVDAEVSLWNFTI